MQQGQQNYRLVAMGLLLLSLTIPAIPSAASGSDTPLTEAKGPCDPRLDGPDYIPGTDADGYPVVPADPDQVSVPEGVLFPLSGKSNKKGRIGEANAYAYLNHDQIDSILSSKLGCPPRQKAH